MRRVMRIAVLALLPFVMVGLATPLSAQSSGAQSPPGCTASEHRQFDFWVGDWEVRAPNGNVVGHNVIERSLDGCVLVERWTGAGPGRGISLNFYDAATRAWHQTWIDNAGRPLFLRGALRESSMVLEASARDTAGREIRQRITWTPLGEGAVRQHWESSTDGGATWRTVFDGRYTKRSGR